jgi:universal stress protein E
MPNIRRILVAVKDLDATTQPGVLKAAQIARACGASLELFHTLTSPVYTDLVSYKDGGVKGFETNLQQKALLKLEKAATRLRKHGLNVSVAAEWDFPAYESVIRRALHIKANLIVIGRHEGRHVLPWLLKLTDWELVRLSPIPVLLVRNKRAYLHPNVLVAVDPTHAFAKPLRLDKKLLQTGDYLSQKLRGTLHAVHAYSRIPIADLPPHGLTVEILEKIGQSADQAANQQFDRLLRTSSIARSRRHLVSAHPTNAIPDTARKIRSSIVVMGAVSRRGLKYLIIGNTAEKILDDLECDVLVVKPTAFPNRVARKSRGAKLMMSAPIGEMGWY